MGVTILAGIDEAGLGPTLGPLVTACAALEVPDDWRPDTPWEKLADACAERHCKKETRPVVADSKVAHRSGGLGALELAVGAFASLAPAGELELAYSDPDAATHPCYRRSLSPFPSVRAADDIAQAAGALRRSLECAGATFLRLRAAVLHEPAMNRRIDGGMNKNQVLLMETGGHIRALAESRPDAPMLLVVDKQGGRNDYHPFLSGLFPGSWIDTLEEGRDCSRYRLRRPGGDVEFHFRAKADRTSFPTALASLAAKYVRERAVARLNAWFEARLPGLRPTAGYPEDAARWLREVEKEGGELEVALVVRKR